MTAQDYREIIKTKMGKKRYIHSINVAKSAVMLANKYGANAEEAEIAGLLHDITKEMPYDMQLQLMKDNGIILSKVQQNAQKLWHSLSGSVYIEKELHISNKNILNAVRFHTTGRENMSILEKIIFVADFIGEERDYKGVDVMRKKAEKSLEEAMLYGLTFSLTDLVNRGLAIDPNQLALYNELVMNNIK